MGPPIETGLRRLRPNELTTWAMSIAPVRRFRARDGANVVHEALQLRLAEGCMHRTLCGHSLDWFADLVHEVDDAPTCFECATNEWLPEALAREV